MSYLSVIRILLVALVFCAFPTPARADLLTIDVAGTPGSGITTWVFSGTAVAEGGGTVRTATDDTFNVDDTFDVIRPGGADSFIAGSSLESVVFSSVPGSAASLTIGDETQSITALYLHDNSPRSEDQFGIRVDAPLNYDAGETTSWSGSLQIGVDITQLSQGTFINQRFTNPEPNFAGPAGDVQLRIAHSPVPEPSTLALLLGLVCLGLGRRYLFLHRCPLDRA